MLQREKIERIGRIGFEVRAKTRRKLVSIDKANVL
jgi:isocitrate/isopropylmalate dehydrogenase